MDKAFLALGILISMPLAFLHAKIITHTPTDKLEYHLSWDGNSTVLKVSLDYTPFNKDSTVFTYGSENFGGQTDIFKVIQNINCNSSDRIKITAKERKITIYHSDDTPKSINYEINGQLVNNPKRAIYDQLFRPVIAKKTLYMVSSFFMLNPVIQKASAFSIQWDSFPANMSYFISTAPRTSPLIKQTLAISKKEDLLLLMGQDLLITSYNVHGIPYYSITSKKDTINNLPAELEPFFKSYFPDLRDFWQDDQAPFYYICALPLFTSNKSMTGGFGCGNGFMMKYAGKFDEWNKKVIAHETAHTWIGQGMVIGNSNFDHQWFGEGFDDYVTILNLVKSGLIDKSGFLNYLNKNVFLKHYTSPVKEAVNDSISPNYWKNDNYQKLPYTRGFIYAFYLDNQIRINSGGTRTIRDFLLALFKKNREIKSTDSTTNLSLNDFITTAANFLPTEHVDQEIDNYIIQGRPLDYRKVKLISDFKIDYDGEVPVLKINGRTDLQKVFSW